METKTNRLIYFPLFLISASVICFEIVATRISSVIFVNNYAFIILSLAILGLGIGGIYSYYKIGTSKKTGIAKVIPSVLALLGFSQLIFILAITRMENISGPVVYFSLLFFPFFFAGIFYAQVFKIYAALSFKLYAADLAGGAIGSAGAIIAINSLGASNSVLLVSAIAFISVVSVIAPHLKRIASTSLILVLLLSVAFLLINGNSNILPPIPIGDFPEKDFHHVYPDPMVKSKIIDSRWSIHGRADLVQYNHQDVVKQLFIDGAAGSQMMGFSGDTEKVSSRLYNLLFRFSTSIPFLFLEAHEKNSMLVIGPGGGKEILTGILTGVDEITGVELNPGFVDMVKDHKAFNGGIYTDFPNVRILIKEGRHFIKQTRQSFDLIVMALPSTEQLQNVDNFAMSENYLLTVEAMNDYLNKLTPEGRLIFTVHNEWELIRLIVTTAHAFEKMGIDGGEVLKHLVVFEDDYTPSILIKREAFSRAEIAHQVHIAEKIPPDFSRISYMPYGNSGIRNTRVDQVLNVLKTEKKSLQRYVNEHPYNIAPCSDDSPYFYKINKGLPLYLVWLFVSIAVLNLALVFIPLYRIKKKIVREKFRMLGIPLLIFICIGLGFMMLEISLFQKLILFLGSPTIALSILLSTLLAGMGAGSYYGKYIYVNNPRKLLLISTLIIIVLGIIFFTIHPFVLNKLLVFSLGIRAFICVLMILPLAFFLGIPFPSAIKLLKVGDLDDYIPWMYGINGAMSVLSAVIAVMVAMLLGISIAFYIGLCFYAIISVLMIRADNV
ncbi:MAG: hypothetical protein ABFS32_15105 [Bacteroidota bacterium]